MVSVDSTHRCAYNQCLLLVERVSEQASLVGALVSESRGGISRFTRGDIRSHKNSTYSTHESQCQAYRSHRRQRTHHSRTHLSQRQSSKPAWSKAYRHDTNHTFKRFRYHTWYRYLYKPGREQQVLRGGPGWRYMWGRRIPVANLCTLWIFPYPIKFRYHTWYRYLSSPRSPISSFPLFSLLFPHPRFSLLPHKLIPRPSLFRHISTHRTYQTPPHAAVDWFSASPFSSAILSISAFISSPSISPLSDYSFVSIHLTAVDFPCHITLSPCRNSSHLTLLSSFFLKTSSSSRLAFSNPLTALGTLGTGTCTVMVRFSNVRSRYRA